ncbi:MAG TPA: creatininase [Verrucomicrobiae bacterium]|nr:creatininase [Verrucomicrobiae bacterium]
MSNFEKLTIETVRAEGARKILILPIGSVEQHGPHLPLTVDIEIPARIAARVIETIDGFAAPAVSYGARSLPQSGGSPDIPGTIRVRGSVLTDYLKDVIAGYIAAGFQSIVVLNGHYENEGFIFEALELCREAGKLDGARIIAVSWWSLLPQSLLDRLFGDRFQGWHAEHASACETSLMLHLRPELVGSARVDHATPPRAGIYAFPIEASEASTRGVLGNTSSSSAEIGKALFEEICAQLVALIREKCGT